MKTLLKWLGKRKKVKAKLTFTERMKLQQSVNNKLKHVIKKTS